MDGNFFYELVGRYGLYAVFFLVMFEGDITLLLGGVLARSNFFGEWSFVKVLAAGATGGALSDQIAYALGRGCGPGVRKFHFYRAAQPRIERLTQKFGALSIFLSKYIYGLRWGSCVFYGVVHMPYWRFLALSLASCFLWALILSGAGYFFSSAIIGLIGDFETIGKFLLVLVILGIVAFYLVERYWLSKKVEEADPERIQKIEQGARKLEQAAEEKLHELGQEIKEHLPPLARRKEPARTNKTDGD